MLWVIFKKPKINAHGHHPDFTGDLASSRAYQAFCKSLLRQDKRKVERRRLLNFLSGIFKREKCFFIQEGLPASNLLRGGKRFVAAAGLGTGV